MRKNRSAKFFVVMLCVLLAFSCALFAACGKKTETPDSGPQTETPSDNTETPPAEVTVTAPSVAPQTQTVDAGSENCDAAFVVDYGGGTFVSLSENGVAVPATCYSRQASRLTLRSEYVKTLAAGEHTFTLTASGGTCTFKVTVERTGILFTDAVRLKSYDGSDILFKIDLGSGSLASVKFGGATLGGDCYELRGSSVALKRAFLGTLPKGLYEVMIYDNVGKYADCAVTIGFEPGEALFYNFDGFDAKTKGYGQDLTVEEGAGYAGTGSKITCQSAGTLLHIGPGNIQYNFVNGNEYSLTAYFRFDNTVAGTSSTSDLLMPVYFKTSDGNADIGYVCYNDEQGYYFDSDKCCDNYQFTKAGDWYRLYIEFTYSSDWREFEMPVWMRTTFTVDSIKITPKSGAMVTPRRGILRVPPQTDTDAQVSFADEFILGIENGSTLLTASDYTYKGGVLTVKASYLATLPAGNHTLTVYLKNGVYPLTVEVNSRPITVRGDSFTFGLDGGDMTFTVNTDGLTLSDATLSDTRGNIDSAMYEISGNTLTLKEAYLQTISEYEDIKIAFGTQAGVVFTVDSYKLLFIDFDNNDLRSGLGIECTTSDATGKSGNGKRIANTSRATMLVLGGGYVPVTFEAGNTYRFEFDMKIESIDTSNNFVLSGNCFMPVMFGTGKDVTYLRVNENNGSYVVRNEGQMLASTVDLVTDSDGFVHISFTFVPTVGCLSLTFDMWMQSSIVIDNLTLIRV